MKIPFLKKPVLPGVKPAALKPTAMENLQRGMISLVDLIAPTSVEVDFRYIRVGERFYSTLFMVGYPRYVSPNWLQPIIDFDHTLDISMFCYPTASADVLSDLRRKIGEMEATIASEEEQGHVVDPKIEAALEDAQALQEELARGVERFFQFSFYITLSGDDLTDMQQSSKQLQSTLSSLLLTGKSATLQMEEGFKSTLPLGQDRLYITRNMDTTSLASTFPFTSAVLTQNKGVMYGVNQQNGSLIVFDRFSLENANEIVLGKSGSGKSYLIKLEIMRQFMLGTEVVVVDPEGEYEKLAKTLGGVVVSFDANSPIKINPFDLSELYEEGENELGLKILSLHGLLKIILGELDAEHDSILDKALVETYQQKGITPDPETQKRQAPLMEDLYKTLLGYENPQAREMALRLEKFIKGSAAGIFNQPSNFDITSPLTVFSIRNLEEELRPIAMHIILDFVWTKVKKTLKRRLLILDEAWYMMKYEDSASFVYSIAKRARKYYLGLTTATQDVEDFLSTEYGKAVLTNSSIQILLKQGTAEVDLAQQIFYLSEGERELLLSADIGEGLFFAGQNHVAVQVVAAPFEHELISSNPEDLLKQKEALARATQTEAEAQHPPAPKPHEPAETPAPDSLASRPTSPLDTQTPALEPPDQMEKVSSPPQVVSENPSLRAENAPDSPSPEDTAPSSLTTDTLPSQTLREEHAPAPIPTSPAEVISQPEPSPALSQEEKIPAASPIAPAPEMSQSSEQSSPVPSEPPVYDFSTMQQVAQPTSSPPSENISSNPSLGSSPLIANNSQPQGEVPSQETPSQSAEPSLLIPSDQTPAPSSPPPEDVPPIEALPQASEPAVSFPVQTQNTASRESTTAPLTTDTTPLGTPAQPTVSEQQVTEPENKPPLMPQPQIFQPSAPQPEVTPAQPQQQEQEASSPEQAATPPKPISPFI